MRTRLVDLLLGLTLAGVLLVVLESALALSGVEPMSDSTNWSRGFNPDATYFVPDKARPGAWRTNYLPKIQGSRFIPPRDERTRVALFGGSNTADFPAGVLQQELNRLAGKRTFDVINLGRSGYGSARVRIIFDQALELLSPDIVVLYMGHNEFVEKGFQLDLEANEPNQLRSRATTLVGTTRLFSSFHEYFNDERESVQSEPDNWKWEYEKFLSLTYRETQQYFAAYETNLREMALAARARGIKVVLCTIVYNRLSAPFSSSFPEDLDASDRARFTELRDRARALLPTYLGPLLPDREQERIHRADWGGGDDPRTRAPARLDGWRPTTGLLGSPDRQLQRESIWKPAVRNLDRALVPFNARELGDRSRADLEQAEDLLRQALAISTDHPRALFELGLVEWLLGRDPKLIRLHLEQAARFDRAPRKGSEAINDIVRGLAEQLEFPNLFDADALFKACHPDAILGWEWMPDHCHLHFGARPILMGALAQDIFDAWPLDEQ